MFVKHGLSCAPEYKCWQQIKARCLNSKHRAYPRYGGRGIDICSEWKEDFLNFYASVGPRPSPQHSLDRYPNNNGNYEPGNVRWATWQEQAGNRRPHRTGEKLRPSSKSGKTTNYKHGMIKSPEYKSWVAMKDRCLNPSSSNYPGWGGLGVKVHSPWVKDFMSFFEYMGARPTPQHSLDRYPNPEGNYEPGNVRWATKQQQSLNRRPLRSGELHGNYDHGKIGSAEYKVWTSIKSRCFNPKHEGFHRYGGAGITLCQRWKNEFTSFLGDVGARPSSEYVLARQNLEESYTCGKCEECRERGWARNGEWLLKVDQNRRRRSVKLTLEKAFQIRQRSLTAGPIQVSQEFGIAPSLVRKIVRGENWVK